METVTTPWLRDDVAHEADLFRDCCFDPQVVQSSTVAVLTVIHGDRMYSAWEMHQRTVAVLAASAAVRAELLEGRP